MANINDIALAAGVSASTVSRVLNGTASISADTREKVLAVAEQLHYRKRRYGSAAKTAENTVGIIMPELASDFYTHLGHRLWMSFKEKGYTSLFSITNFDQEDTVRSVEQMAAMHVSCLLMVMDDTEHYSKRLIEAVRLSLLPIMFITSQYIPDLDVDCIYIDEERGNTMAVEHLLRRGYRNIGFIGEKNTLNRYEYFKKTMKANSVPVNNSLVRLGKERGEEGGYLRMQELLTGSQLPDAIYASYDQMAIGAIRAINEAGLSVPRDIAIIGFDNVPTSRYVAGGITTISAPFEDIASISSRILTHRVRQPFGQPQQIAIKPSLIVRATT